MALALAAEAPNDGEAGGGGGGTVIHRRVALRNTTLAGLLCVSKLLNFRILTTQDVPAVDAACQHSEVERSHHCLPSESSLLSQAEVKSHNESDSPVSRLLGLEIYGLPPPAGGAWSVSERCAVGALA